MSGGTFYQYLPYFLNKKTNKKNREKSNIKKIQKKHKIWFSESLFPKVHLEKGGRLIIRVILYTGQSCIILTVVLLLSPCPGDSVFHCESETTLFKLPIEETTRNQ